MVYFGDKLHLLGVPRTMFHKSLIGPTFLLPTREQDIFIYVNVLCRKIRVVSTKPTGSALCRWLGDTSMNTTINYSQYWFGGPLTFKHLLNNINGYDGLYLNYINETILTKISFPAVNLIVCYAMFIFATYVKS